MEGERGASDRDRTTIGIFLRRESQRERERGHQKLQEGKRVE